MTEPTTPSDARRHELRRARWVAAGAAVGAAAVLGGTIAVVNAAPSTPTSSNQLMHNGVDDDEYVPAEPFQPQTQSPTPKSQSDQPAASPQLTPSSRSTGTRSGGS